MVYKRVNEQRGRLRGTGQDAVVLQRGTGGVNGQKNNGVASVESVGIVISSGGVIPTLYEGDEYMKRLWRIKYKLQKTQDKESFAETANEDCQ